MSSKGVVDRGHFPRSVKRNSRLPLSDLIFFLASFSMDNAISFDTMMFMVFCCALTLQVLRPSM